MLTKKAPKGLIWIGDGSRYIPGVPARDLSPEEVGDDPKALIASGLYTEAASASAATEKADTDKE